MGEIIEIQEEVTPGSFRIKFTVTGEERLVSIDPEKSELFRVPGSRTQQLMACPFLQKTGNKKFACAVHGSRPELCRQYFCSRTRQSDSPENVIGSGIDAFRNIPPAGRTRKKE
jgi:Fe-S-cluster containining protein